ncbi:unnamed protein product [Caenorhabditis bovis]|uniref:RING-CH-type domain-containing protein n=1 Tax=Caenorhabditis bovis TaxID=2654633 RepID=A0A8S1FDM9_9PELO|nr:unnamed protein product [Caenorhabditis bovis]
MAELKNPVEKEKEPLIDDDSAMAAVVATSANDEPLTFWKGCEFLKTSKLCSSSLSLQLPNAKMCRICHTTSSTRSNPLISPCRCSGTLKYVHRGCVVRWLEMSSQKMVPSPKCELCGYDFRRGNICQLRSLHLPYVDQFSMVLNIVFVTCMIISLLCWYFIFQFLTENTQTRSKLAVVSSASYWSRRGYNDEAFDRRPFHPNNKPIFASMMDWRIYTCVGMFLFTFGVGIGAQYRADCTIFRCIFRFFVINYNWMIKNYDPKNDPELGRKSARSVEPTEPMLHSSCV